MATTKKNILKLDTLAIEEDFFENIALIGISSEKPAYTLAHNFNQAFQLNFARKPKLDVKIGKKTEEFSFAVYQSPVARSAFCYTLYKLKVDDVHLLPSIRNIDYIWMIADEDAEFAAMNLLQSLRAMPEIQFASLLEKDKIKNIDYLIL